MVADIIDIRSGKKIRKLGAVKKIEDAKNPWEFCKACKKPISWDDWDIAVDEKKKKEKWQSGLLLCPECGEYQEETNLSRMGVVDQNGIILNIPFDVLCDIETEDDTAIYDIKTALYNAASALVYRRYKKTLEDFINGK